MKYVTYNATGELTGAYMQDMQPDHQSNSIEIGDEYAEWTKYRAKADRTGIELAPVIAPVPIVPSSVTMRQARLALLGAGLLAGVNAAIAGLTEPTKSAAIIEWEYASEVQRSSGLVPAMATALGMTDAQIDSLFITASSL